MERCFYQVFRPEAPFYANGWGDCSRCSVDEQNKHCQGYHKIILIVFEVVE